MYFESLEAILKVLSAIKTFKLSRKENKDKLFEAVEAIREAANRTKYYYSNLQDDFEKPNIDLSEHWLKAASAVRGFDNDLYNRLLDKADFWANPSSWTMEMSQQHNIYLDDIIEDSNKFLKQLSD